MYRHCKRELVGGSWGSESSREDVSSVTDLSTSDSHPGRGRSLHSKNAIVHVPAAASLGAMVELNLGIVGVLRDTGEPAEARDLSVRGVSQSRAFSTRASAAEGVRVCGEIPEDRGDA